MSVKRGDISAKNYQKAPGDHPKEEAKNDRNKEERDADYARSLKKDELMEVMTRLGYQGNMKPMLKEQLV